MKKSKTKPRSIVPIDNPLTNSNKNRKPKENHPGFFGQKGISKYHN